MYLNKVAGIYFFHSLSYHSLNDLQKAKESYTKVIKSEFDVVIRTPMKCQTSFHMKTLHIHFWKWHVIFICSRIRKDLTCSLCSLVKYFLALEDKKFHISVQAWYICLLTKGAMASLNYWPWNLNQSFNAVIYPLIKIIGFCKKWIIDLQ